MAYRAVHPDVRPENATAAHVAAIYQRAWWVRHYPRSMQRAERARAMHELGLACRDAFNQVEDYEALLSAIVDALAPHAPRF